MFFDTAISTGFTNDCQLFNLEWPITHLPGVEANLSSISGYAVVTNGIIFGESRREAKPLNSQFDRKNFIGLYDVGELTNIALYKHEIGNIASLNSRFHAEIARVNSNSIDIDKVSSIFNRIIRGIAQMPFENCSIEILRNEALKISLVFKENKLLVLTNAFHGSAEHLSNDDIMYSFFINRKLIASDVATFQTFAKEFKEYIYN